MKDEELYNGWLVSNSLVKRSIAVWGHLIVAQLILYGLAIIAYCIILLIVAGVSLVL